MAKINLIIDTKNTDEIIYKNKNKTFTLDTRKFINKLYRMSKIDNSAAKIKLPKNCLSISGIDKITYEIEIGSYSDYITCKNRDWDIKETKKYFIKWPKMVIKATIKKDKIINVVIEVANKKFLAPNVMDGGNLCMGSYDPIIKDITKLEQSIKTILQVPFNGDFWKSDPTLFFSDWEKHGYQKALKLYKKEGGA